MNNLFSNLPAHLTDELVSVLAENQNVRIERIVSTGQTSPEDFWYDQEENEWVVLLQGEARVRFESDDHSMHLTPGDHIAIPAHRRHRVEWTTPVAPTVWLAIFYSDH